MVNESSPTVAPDFRAQSQAYYDAVRRAERAALGLTEERSPEEIMASIEASVNREIELAARRGLGLSN